MKWQPSAWVPARRARIGLIGLSLVTAAYVASIYLVDREAKGFSPLWDDWVYNCVLAAAGVIALSRGVYDRSARAESWCIGAAIMLWFLGNASWTICVRPLDDPPYPSIADLGYLLFYPPAIVGVLLAGRGRAQWRNPVVLLDGLIAGLSVAAVGAVLALGPVAEAATGGVAALVTNLAYPVMDLFLVALVLTLGGLSGWRLRRDQVIMVGSLAVWAVVDSAYVVRVATDTYASGTWLDAGWLVPTVALAWSQWTVSPPQVGQRPAHGRAVWVPVAFLAVAMAVFGPALAREVPPVALVALAAALAVTGARIVVTLQELERLAASEREAREARIAALALARAQVEQANVELEQRVQARTADLEGANRRLTATAEKLRQSNRELQDFAYVASHDLQEPLRKVQTFGSRLEARFGDQLSEDGLDYLSRMQGAAQRMSVLINDLLTFSRVASRGEGFSQVDLGTIAKEVLSDLEVSIDESEAVVDIGPMVSLDADPTQMRQLLQNLVGNALKFRAPDRRPHVTITTVFVPGPAAGTVDDVPSQADAVHGLDGDAYCRITVRDNGIGFDTKYTDRIFTVFQRLHGRSEYEGSGIGLAVCRRIVERHRGVITATSEPGRGATFTIHLPVTQPEETQS